MNNSTQHRSWIFAIPRRAAGAALALAIVLAPAVIATRSAQAQAYTAYSVFSFAGAPDGAYPAGAGLVLDALGNNLYGTTYYGGDHSAGTVFKVDTNLNETRLYSFTGTGGDGAYPYAGVMLDAGGNNLYGTTVQGGTYGAGTVFKVNTMQPIIETPLYSFSGTGGDGAYPYAGLVWDGSGNLYGTTELGGDLACNGGNGCGTVFKLDKNNHEIVLHRFTGTGGDGRTLYGEGVVRDGKGNLYGATELGGDYAFCQSSGCGTVFKMPNTTAPIETVLYSFTGTGGDGFEPGGGVVLDGNGNLYGTTIAGGTYGYGTVFMVDPNTRTETVLYSFKGGTDGRWPQAGLVLDAGKNILYGTTYLGGSLTCQDKYGCGTVFRVNTDGSNEGVLYSFPGFAGDGAFPISGLVLDGNGNLYGTTSGGGTYGNGTVFKLTP